MTESNIEELRVICPICDRIFMVSSINWETFVNPTDSRINGVFLSEQGRTFCQENCRLDGTDIR